MKCKCGNQMFWGVLCECKQAYNWYEDYRRYKRTKREGIMEKESELFESVLKSDSICSGDLKELESITHNKIVSDLQVLEVRIVELEREKRDTFAADDAARENARWEMYRAQQNIYTERKKRKEMDVIAKRQKINALEEGKQKETICPIKAGRIIASIEADIIKRGCISSFGKEKTVGDVERWHGYSKEDQDYLALEYNKAMRQQENEKLLKEAIAKHEESKIIEQQNICTERKKRKEMDVIAKRQKINALEEEYKRMNDVIVARQLKQQEENKYEVPPLGRYRRVYLKPAKKNSKTPPEPQYLMSNAELQTAIDAITEALLNQGNAKMDELKQNLCKLTSLQVERAETVIMPIEKKCKHDNSLPIAGKNFIRACKDCNAMFRSNGKGVPGEWVE